ncbi:paraneoplastic antigen Ma3-like [Anneissia japonica]|uniref:paraneoplastic antigen Ma3-like n=1 Tax=Anneissia japonica TaxID=1529436 RepID=UPI001425613B|nr:paraneoplastic antigen Ma3-like [Anneissia japonica]
MAAGSPDIPSTSNYQSSSAPYFQSSSPAPNPTVDTLPSDFVRSFARCTLAANHRKLRCFSGLPSPSRDEDDYSSWIDHVEGQMDEWQDLDDAEKRRRIRVALRPPSLSIINDLRRDNPAATSYDYLRALDMAFGDTETDNELFVKFHTTTQKEGETPSKFLNRLQNILRRVLRRGIVPRAQSDGVRLNQFIRGILFDEMVIVNLHLRDKTANPPSFLSLLSSVRKQEEEERLKRESRGLPKQPPVTYVQHFQHTTPPIPTNEQPSQNPQKQASKGRRRDNQTATDQGTMVDFCFRCGEGGHIRRRCPNPANIELVNRRLVKLVLGGKMQGNSSGHLAQGNQGSTQRF